MPERSIKRTIFYAVLILLFLAEFLFLRKIPPAASSPEILIAATIFFGLNFGPLSGLESGMILGLLKSVFSVEAAPIIVVPFLIIGVLSGALRSRFSKDNIISQFIFSNLAVWLFGLFIFMSFTEEARLNAGSEWLKILALKGVYTGLLAPLLFIILWQVFKVTDIS